MYLFTVVYILQIVHWNPDKTTPCKLDPLTWLLCISFKLFIEILTKQPFWENTQKAHSCVYPSNCSLKSWQNNVSVEKLLAPIVVYILQIVHWNPDKTTVLAVWGMAIMLCISFKLFIEILTKQHKKVACAYTSSCVYPSNCSLKSWQNNILCVYRWLSMTYKESQD